MIVANILQDRGERSEAEKRFGRIVYAEFLRKGVQDMPPLPKPLTEADLRNPHLANRLPATYGQDLGKRALFLLQKYYRLRPDEAEDALSDFYVKKIAHVIDHVKEGSPLHEAEAYVLTSLGRLLVDRLRSEIRGQRDRRKEVYVVDEDVEEGDSPSGPSLDSLAHDDSMMRQLEDRLTPSQLEELNSRLARVHHALPTYLRLLVEGYETVEIMDNKMIPSFSKGMFWQVKPAFFATIKDFFEDMPFNSGIRNLKKKFGPQRVAGTFDSYLAREVYRTLRAEAQQQRAKWRPPSV
jgi:DNA-directed RNA polymerase specialized sigma24 family protein